jgi:hypothetical protein
MQLSDEAAGRLAAAHGDPGLRTAITPPLYLVDAATGSWDPSRGDGPHVFFEADGPVCGSCGSRAVVGTPKGCVAGPPFRYCLRCSCGDDDIEAEFPLLVEWVRP